MMIRDMTCSDLDAVLAIERESFDVPWERNVFVNEMKSPYTRFYVAEEMGVVCGYLIAWILPGLIHIINLAVTSARRRKGTGGKLVAAVIEGAAHEPVYVRLEVRPSNTAARRLYRNLGFKAAGVKKEYYPGGEDALVMQKYLTNASICI